MGIWEVLQWLVPAGVLSNIVVWLVSRRTFNARNKHEREDLYKKLYEAVSATTEKLQAQNSELRDMFLKLQEDNMTITNVSNENKYKIQKMERMVARIVAKARQCRSWPQCPIAPELQMYRPADKVDSRARGQPERREGRDRELHDDPGSDDDTDPDAGTDRGTDAEQPGHRDAQP